MDVHEYQAKQILWRFGAPVPRGGLAYSPEQADYRARELGGKAWVVKAQIHSGGRGTDGGVKVCKTPDKVHEFAGTLFGKQLATILKACDRAYRDLDAVRVEINPPVITGAGDLIALDAKMSFDTNALFRNPQSAQLRDRSHWDPRESTAGDHGLADVGLDCDIGCIINGAGLAMATMGMIKLAGGAPANFLDIGGDASPERVVRAIRTVLADPKVSVIHVNIFAGINRCDWIAGGVVKAYQEVGLTIPVMVRLAGPNVEERNRIIATSGLPLITADTLADAAAKAVAARPRKAA